MLAYQILYRDTHTGKWAFIGHRSVTYSAEETDTLQAMYSKRGTVTHRLLCGAVSANK